MGTQKKEANRKVREGKSNDGMGNVKTKGENFYRYAVLYGCPFQRLWVLTTSSAALRSV
jgi:hypothetical protein